MIRVFELGPSGPLRKAAAESLRTASSDAVRWVDLSNPTDAELAELHQHFGFHPLTLDDCRSFGQRPKLDDYGDYLFLVTHRVTCSIDANSPIEGQELHVFLGKSFLVTVHQEELPELEAIAERLQTEHALCEKGVAFIYYLLADRIAEANFDIIDVISERIETIEAQVLDGGSSEVLRQVLALRQGLTLARRMLSPQREVFLALSKREEFVDARTAIYFRDVYDQVIRLWEMLEMSRDLLGNVLDAHFTLLSNRTNEIMKSLTLLSAIFMPLTFVTGFFGQNFAHLPFASDALMWTSIGACFALPVSMLLWFRSRRWM